MAAPLPSGSWSSGRAASPVGCGFGSVFVSLADGSDLPSCGASGAGGLRSVFSYSLMGRGRVLGAYAGGGVRFSV